MSDLNGSLAECNVKMNKAIDVAKEDFSTIRTGRAPLTQQTQMGEPDQF